MKRYILGVDEAGRGPLAGPVAVGAVLMPRNFRPRSNKIKARLKDSKKLTPKTRSEWYFYLKNHPKIHHTVVMINPKTIDKINISNAVNLAASKAIKRLVKSYKLEVKKLSIYLDAGIKPKLATYNLQPITLVRGDEKINAIKLASIAAKVTRDEYMKKESVKFPKYNFHINKGYGTKAHLAALEKYGPSPIHRLTFIKNYYRI